jgi:Txe/YoeB family toxin of toxin-antitoxin system
MDDLIFNELSVKPQPAKFEQLNQRVKSLVSLCKQAREQFNFKKLRFTQQFHEYQLLAEGMSFDDYVRDKRIHPTIKTLLLDLRCYPFIDDADEQVSTQYLENQFYFQKNGEKLKCDGLATAYLYNTLAVSFSSENIWDNVQVTILVKKESAEFFEAKNVFHLSKSEHLETKNEMRDWLLENIQQNICSVTDLKRLYPHYQFESQAFDDLLYWKKNDKELYDRLHLLLRDIELNRFTGGLGKTEVLKQNWSGCASKRLNDEHRIVYSLKGNIIYRCKGHYND